jgi:hypothetical protein
MISQTSGQAPARRMVSGSAVASFSTGMTTEMERGA